MNFFFNNKKNKEENSTAPLKAKVKVENVGGINSMIYKRKKKKRRKINLRGS